MKWTNKEEEIVKKLLINNKKFSYSKISKKANEMGINRTKKAIQHKNNRYWNIPREVKIPLPVRVGKDNPNWKGGKTTHSKGYVYIYCPEHPRASNRYVFEHILVIEEKIGRYLRRGEVIHHINGIKNDNRPENLEILNEREHALKQFPFSIEQKEGLYRGRIVSNEKLSIHPDVLSVIPSEFYLELNDNKVILYLNENT